MDMKALIRVAEALDARVQEALAPAVKEVRHVQDSFGLLYRIALDLDQELARLILLWTGLEIPPEGKRVQAVPPWREQYPAIPAFQAISSLIPVTISLASLMERESTVFLPSPSPGPEGGERGERGAPGYPVPSLAPVPAILMAAGLQKRVMHALAETAAGLPRDIRERIPLHVPGRGKGLPESPVPPSPPTDLTGIMQMIDGPRRIIEEMVKAGEGRMPGPPGGPETGTPPRQAAGALALGRDLLRDVTVVSPIATYIARLGEISHLMQQPAGAFPVEGWAPPPLTRMSPGEGMPPGEGIPPGEERWAEAPMPSPPVSRPAALRPIIEIPHLVPPPRQPAPEVTGPATPPPSTGTSSRESPAWAAPQLPAAPGFAHALGGLAASRHLVSGFMDQLAPFIRRSGGVEAGGVPVAVAGAFPAPAGTGAATGLAAAWPWIDWIPPAAVAETLAAGLPFGVMPSPGGGEAQASILVPWPMAREILPGLPFERVVSLMPAGAGTVKAIASVLEPFLVTIPPAGSGGLPTSTGFPAPIAP
ncbi:MAG: hypothetical protein LUO97_00315, partial [Methanomicrobiales archaeon]|nr:hypothetical protein [Methanomicrobiales archaeon]